MGTGREYIKDKIDRYGFAKWADVVPLQPDDLKKYTFEQINKLKASIKKNGFASPLFIWENKNKMILLDGFHRIIAFKELLSEGVSVPVEIPSLFIKCKDVKDAKKTLLLLNSHYAEIQKKQLFEFVSDINLDELNTEIDIPNFNFEFRENDSIGEEIKEDNTREEFGDSRDTESLTKLFSRYDKILCSFSGGKDSIAMILDLIDLGVKDKIELLFCAVPLFGFSDEIEYAKYSANFLGVPVTILKTDETEQEIISKLKKRGYPGRMLNWCNSDYKVKPLNDYYKTIKEKYIMAIGTRADESARRAEMKPRGVWNKRDFCFPIFDMSTEEVVKKVKDSKIKVHHAYRHFGRFSCATCYQQTKVKWRIMREFYKEEYNRALSMYALSTESESFRNCDYSSQLIKNMVCDPKENSEENDFILGFTSFWDGPNG